MKEIDELKDLAKHLFTKLETEIAKIDDNFNSVELDFMYGNINENFYEEKMNKLNTDIHKVKQKLFQIQDLENRLN